MVDSIYGNNKKTLVPILLDDTFKRSRDGYLNKYGIKFILKPNGRYNFRGSLSEFWNRINDISNTNYPLLPLKDLNTCLNAFEDVFNIRLNDIDITRIDCSVDVDYDVFINLNSLDIVDKQYDVKVFEKFETSVSFFQKKEFIVLLFYQNAAMGRPDGVRYETRFNKNAVPFKYGSEINEDKIRKIILPFMENKLNQVYFKNEDFNPQLEQKPTYKTVSRNIYEYGLMQVPNQAFIQLMNVCKNKGMERHQVNRIINERNTVLIETNSLLIDDPIKKILLTLKQL